MTKPCALTDNYPNNRPIEEREGSSTLKITDNLRPLSDTEAGKPNEQQKTGALSRSSRHAHDLGRGRARNGRSKLAGVREVRGSPMEGALARVEGDEDLQVSARRARTGVWAECWFQVQYQKRRQFSSSKQTRRLGGQERGQERRRRKRRG